MPGLCRVDGFYWVQRLKAPSTVRRECCCPGIHSHCSQGTKIKTGLVLLGLNHPSVSNAATLQPSVRVWQFTTFISSEFHVFNIYSFWEKLMKPANSPMTLPGSYPQSFAWTVWSLPSWLGYSPSTSLPWWDALKQQGSKSCNRLIRIWLWCDTL